MVDLDEFFKESLDLMMKFKYRLSQHVNNTCLEKYTLDKIDKAHVLLDNLCQQWEERRDRVVHAKRKVLQELDIPLTNNEYLSIMHAMRELSKKYYELDSLSLSDDVWDNTIDAIMTKMEEVDGKIADAFERADKMMGKVEEKLYKVAGVATEQIDKLKFAVSYGSQRLLMYDELPGPWQSNEVCNNRVFHY
jgi:adiponectin receptor